MKNRFFVLMLTVMVILSVSPILPVFAEIDASIFEAGTGTKTDPYQIKTLSQLEKFSESVNNDDDYSNVYVKLTANIDMSDTYGSGKSSWVPIGRSNSFDGIFDGGGFKIENMYIDAEWKNSKGFFGYVGNGTIKNLGVSGTISRGAENIGGIVGWNQGVVSNCYSEVAVSGQEEIGGIVGYNRGTVSKCYNLGLICSGAQRCGGIVGEHYSGSISECYNNSEISNGGAYCGGIVGYVDYGTVQNSYNAKPVSGDGNYVGGIAGYVVNGSIIGCYNKAEATVTGKQADNGGIVGYADEGTISNCYNAAAVKGTYGGNGGISGMVQKAKVYNCYNSGAVAKPETYPGSTGSITAGKGLYGTFTNCYYLKGTSENGYPSSFYEGIDGIECKTEEEFKSGEVAWRLQNGQSSQFWGQNLASNGDTAPILTNSETKAVNRVAFMLKSGRGENATFVEYKVMYVNKGTTVKPPQISDRNVTDLHWTPSATERDKVFDENTVIESDMTIYAAGTEIIVPTEANDQISLKLGDEATINLNDYVKNKSGNPNDFTFELIDGSLPYGMSFSDGVISGKPQTACAMYVLFSVTNNSGIALLSFDEENNYLALTINVSPKVTYIRTFSDLDNFRESVNGGKDYSGEVVVLMDDIDMDDRTSSGGRISWWAIGMGSKPFNGTFDGDGHKLTNLYVDGGNASDNEGLFGFIGGSAVIKNLSVSGTVTGNTNVAGVVGYNNGTVIGCYSDVAVTGISESIGGVVGLNLGTITSCGNSGTVSGVSSIGGVAGNSDYGRISQSYNTGTVTGNDNVGGITGKNSLEITNCYNTGSVSGDIYVAGIVGNLTVGTITNCYNTGSITTSYGAAGGVVGNNNAGTITSCYYLENSYSGNNTDGFSEVINTDRLLNLKSFAGWDFENIWDMGNEGPVLRKPVFEKEYYPDDTDTDTGSENEAPGFEIQGIISEDRKVAMQFGAAGDYTLIFVRYNENGCVANIAFKPFQVTEGYWWDNVDYPEMDFTLGTGDVIMLWSNTDTIIPMCEPYVVH